MSMLMPPSARVRNMVAATPGWLRMPTPTMETFTTPVSQTTCRALRLSLTCSRRGRAFLASVREMVKEMSLRPSSAEDWMIMSTLTPSSARAPKILDATPGRSGKSVTVTLAWLRSKATPDTTTSSIRGTSPVINVPSSSVKEERTWMSTAYFFPTSMERACMTWAPAPASSSISS